MSGENNNRSAVANRRTFVAAVVVSAIIVVVAVYGYPRIFPSIIDHDPDNFAQTVSRALESGDLKHALRIARAAADSRRTDPEAQTMYGRVLEAAGQLDAARGAYEAAVGIAVEPAPSSRETHKPYFYTAARVALAQMAIANGDEASALHHLELARGYDPINPVMPSSRAAFDLYVKHNAWNRALDFATPTREELNLFDAAQFVALSNAAAHRAQWDYASEMAQAAIERDESLQAAAMMKGRLSLRANRFDDAEQWFQRAGVATEGASFFLGISQSQSAKPDAARLSWENEASGSLYKPFATAKLADPQSMSGVESVQADLEALQWISLKNEPRSYTGEEQRPYSVAMSLAWETYGDVFPVLLRRKTRETQGAVPRVEMPSDDVFLLFMPEEIIQLVWIANAGPLTINGADGTRPPGWVDPLLDWRSAQATLRSASPTTRVFSFPVNVAAGESYLLLAQSHPSVASTGWTFLTNAEVPDAVGSLDRAPHNTNWAAICATAILEWEAVRLERQINVNSTQFETAPVIFARIPPLPTR